jgi:hypothetical protein
MKLKDCEFLVRWSKEDEEWVATCNKFPSLRRVSPYAREALQGMMGQALESIQDMKRQEGRPE